MNQVLGSIHTKIYILTTITFDEQKQICFKKSKDFSKILIDKLQKRFKQLPSLLNFKCLNISTLKKLKSQHLENFGQAMLKNLICHFNSNYKKDIDLKNNLFSEKHLTEEYKKFKTLVSTEWSKLEPQEIYDKVDRSMNFMRLNRLLKMYRCLPLSSVECERVFSSVNLIKTELRNWLEDNTLDDLLLTSRNKVEIKDFDFTEAYQDWKAQKKRYFV